MSNHSLQTHLEDEMIQSILSIAVGPVIIVVTVLTCMLIVYCNSTEEEQDNADCQRERNVGADCERERNDDCQRKCMTASRYNFWCWPQLVSTIKSQKARYHNPVPMESEESPV